jgi:hypothetical protein
MARGLNRQQMFVAVHPAHLVAVTPSLFDGATVARPVG